MVIYTRQGLLKVAICLDLKFVHLRKLTSFCLRSKNSEKKMKKTAKMESANEDEYAFGSTRFNEEFHKNQHGNL